VPIVPAAQSPAVDVAPQWPIFGNIIAIGADTV